MNVCFYVYTNGRMRKWIYDILCRRKICCEKDRSQALLERSQRQTPLDEEFGVNNLSDSSEEGIVNILVNFSIAHIYIPSLTNWQLIPIILSVIYLPALHSYLDLRDSTQATRHQSRSVSTRMCCVTCIRDDIFTFLASEFD